MSLHVLACNLKRVMNIPGTKPLIQAIQAGACVCPSKYICQAALCRFYGEICTDKNE